MKNIIQLEKKILIITQKEKEKALLFLQFLELNEMIMG